jgi:dTDP-4-dehydrorhamnose 3,5-epimerase
MKFIETEFLGPWIIEPTLILDERGFFAETWSQREFEKVGIKGDFKQGNIAYNKMAHTLRGLHFQLEPHAEDKLVRVVKGSIFDVILDIRPHSQTFGKWQGITLSSKNFRQVYIPKGFAHGYQTLENETYVSYEVTEFYQPGFSKGILWSDPALNIQWPKPESGQERIISPKDMVNLELSQTVKHSQR